MKNEHVNPFQQIIYLKYCIYCLISIVILLIFFAVHLYQEIIYLNSKINFLVEEIVSLNKSLKDFQNLEFLLKENERIGLVPLNSYNSNYNIFLLGLVAVSLIFFFYPSFFSNLMNSESLGKNLNSLDTKTVDSNIVLNSGEFVHFTEAVDSTTRNIIRIVHQEIPGDYLPGIYVRTPDDPFFKIFSMFLEAHREFVIKSQDPEILAFAAERLSKLFENLS